MHVVNIRFLLSAMLFCSTVYAMEHTKDTKGGTDNTRALFAFAKSGDIKGLRQLLSNSKVDVNARDNDNWTPLHSAA